MLNAAGYTSEAHRAEIIRQRPCMLEIALLLLHALLLLISIGESLERAQARAKGERTLCASSQGEQDATISASRPKKLPNRDNLARASPRGRSASDPNWQPWNKDIIIVRPSGGAGHRSGRWVLLCGPDHKKKNCSSGPPPEPRATTFVPRYSPCESLRAIKPVRVQARAWSPKAYFLSCLCCVAVVQVWLQGNLLGCPWAPLCAASGSCLGTVGPPTPPST